MKLHNTRRIAHLHVGDFAVAAGIKAGEACGQRMPPPLRLQQRSD
jgi:hypothetical protein